MEYDLCTCNKKWVTPHIKNNPKEFSLMDAIANERCQTMNIIRSLNLKQIQRVTPELQKLEPTESLEPKVEPEVSKVKVSRFESIIE